MSRYVDPVAKAEREARIMRRYRKLVVGLAIVAFLGQFEGMYFAGVALFLLPYFLLWYSNTALIYTLAAFPLVRRYARDGTVFVRDFLAIAAVAVLPAFVGEYLAWPAFNALVSRNDFALATGMTPRSFKIPSEGDQRPNNLRRGGDFSRPDELRGLCGHVCQGLLLGGHADAVYVGLRRGGNFWRFHIAEQKPCPSRLSELRKDAAARLGAGRCLIEERVDEIAADVVISESWPRPQGLDFLRSGGCSTSGWMNWVLRVLPARSADRRTEGIIEVAERKGGEWKLVERVSPASVSIPPFPFYFGLQDCTSAGIISAYPVASFVRVGAKSDTVVGVLRRRYGIELPPSPIRWVDGIAIPP